MKAHVGVDSQHKVIHSVVVTPANTADCKVLDQLLHGEEGRVYGDQAYKGQGDLIRAKAPKAKDFTNRQCKWKHYIDDAIKAKNQTKSRIRSRVEHSIGVIKRVFGFRKVRYRGLAKTRPPSTAMRDLLRRAIGASLGLPSEPSTTACAFAVPLQTSAPQTVTQSAAEDASSRPTAPRVQECTCVALMANPEVVTTHATRSRLRLLP
jgi:hypothetical protein